MAGDEDYDHLAWPRAPDENERRRRGPPLTRRVEDEAGHAAGLLGQLHVAEVAAEGQEPGFDDRLLLTFRFDGKPPEGLRAFPGLEVVSEEAGKLAVVFATEEGKREFENRLRLVQRGEKATRRDVLFAMDGVEAWTPEDRTGLGLQEVLAELQRAGGRRRFDVELWPLTLDRPQDAERMSLGTSAFLRLNPKGTL